MCAYHVVSLVCMTVCMDRSNSVVPVLAGGSVFHFPFAYWPAPPRRFGRSDLNSCFHFLCLYAICFESCYFDANSFISPWQLRLCKGYFYKV